MRKNRISTIPYQNCESFPYKHYIKRYEGMFKDRGIKVYKTYKTKKILYQAYV